MNIELILIFKKKLFKGLILVYSSFMNANFIFISFSILKTFKQLEHERTDML